MDTNRATSAAVRIRAASADGPSAASAPMTAPSTAIGTATPARIRQSPPCPQSRSEADSNCERPEARIRLTCSIEENQLALSVADNGPGLPTDDPEGVFVPFYTTKAGGSGIGLTLARQIALGHGGRLDYRAATPHGAIFRLVLPQT